MGDWVRYDENFDGSEDGGCLYVRDNEDGTYDVAGVMWLDSTGDQKPYYAFEASVSQGDCFDDDLTVTDAWTASYCFPYLDDDYVTSVIGEFDTLAEGEKAVEEFYGERH